MPQRITETVESAAPETDLIVVSESDLVAAITTAIVDGVTWELEPYATAIADQIAIDVIRRLGCPERLSSR